jgi:hypothetical protein
VRALFFLALAACSGSGAVPVDAPGGGDASTAVPDAPGSDAPIVLDAPSSGDAGIGGLGAICAGAPDGAVAVACAPGLACCYPCGIPGCASRCAEPCDAGYCPGGCPLIP